MAILRRAILFFFTSVLYAAAFVVGPFFRAYDRLRIRRLPKSPAELARRIDVNIAQLLPIFKAHEPAWCQILSDHQERLRKSDYSRIPELASSFSGVGSLGDVFICVENGDGIPKEDEKAVNRRVQGLVEDLSLLARAMEAVLRERGAGG